MSLSIAYTFLPFAALKLFFFKQSSSAVLIAFFGRGEFQAFLRHDRRIKSFSASHFQKSHALPKKMKTASHLWLFGYPQKDEVERRRESVLFDAVAINKKTFDLELDNVGDIE